MKRVHLCTYIIYYSYSCISTNQEKNLAISSNGRILSFGSEENKADLKLDLEQKESEFMHTASSGCRWKYIFPEAKIIQAVYVSCGYTHNCVVTDKGYPYVWGNNINGRWGIQLHNKYNEADGDDTESDEENLNPNDLKYEGLYIENPQLVQEMRRTFKRNWKEEKLYKKLDDKGMGGGADHMNDHGDSDSDEGMKLKNLKFSVQEKLKETKMVLNEETIKMKDQSLKSTLNGLVSRINKNLNLIQVSRYHQYFITESVIISGIYKFPVKIEHNDCIRSSVPKLLIKKKDVYEEIFTLLQLHPCYIKNIIENYQYFRKDKDLNKHDTLQSIINSLFLLKYENSSSQRAIYTLLNLTRHIILTKQNNDLHEIISSKNMFHQLFLMILDGQSSNRVFKGETVKVMATYFVEFWKNLEKQGIDEGSRGKRRGFG